MTVNRSEGELRHHPAVPVARSHRVASRRVGVAKVGRIVADRDHPAALEWPEIETDIVHRHASLTMLGESQPFPAILPSRLAQSCPSATPAQTRPYPRRATYRNAGPSRRVDGIAVIRNIDDRSLLDR